MWLWRGVGSARTQQPVAVLTVARSVARLALQDAVGSVKDLMTLSGIGGSGVCVCTIGHTVKVGWVFFGVCVTFLLARSAGTAMALGASTYGVPRSLVALCLC